MRKILAGLVLVFMLACSANADIVYTTSNGKLGYIQITQTLSADNPVQKYSGFQGDSTAAHFYNVDGNSFIALIEPETDTQTSSGDKAFIFNMSNLESPINNDEPEILTGVYNTRSVGYSDNHRGLFFASSVNNTSRISEFNTDNLEIVRSYSYTSSNDQAFMSSIIVAPSSIFCLINKATSQDSLFLRFDGQLKDNIEDFSSIKADYEANTIALLNENRIILAHSDGIDVLTNGEFVPLLSTDNPVKAMCRDKGNGFYFITESSNGQQSLRHYTSSSEEISTITSGSSQSGITKAIYYNADDKKFAAFIMNDKIAIYNLENDNLVKEFSSSELGGVPVSITAGRANTESTENSGDNGCNITGSGALILLLALNFMLLRKRFSK